MANNKLKSLTGQDVLRAAASEALRYLPYWQPKTKDALVKKQQTLAFLRDALAFTEDRR